MAWKNAWTTEDDYFSQAFNDVAQRLATRVNPALLEPGAELVLSSANKHIQDIGPRADLGELNRSAIIAAVLSARIPGLQAMSVDEVLGLRSDLTDYLPGFRSAMVGLAEEVGRETDTTRRSLANEIELRWQRDIGPALEEIRYQVEANSYSRNLLSAFSEDKGTLASSATSVVLAVGSVFAGIGALVPAAAAAAFPFIRALNQTIKAREDVRKNRLYFLYRAQRTARGRRVAAKDA